MDHYDFAALAYRTANGLGLHLHGEADLSFPEGGTAVIVVPKPESMIQNACGHEGFLSVGCFGEHPIWKPDCPLFSTPKYAQSG
jgi:hypothetical protein